MIDRICKKTSFENGHPPADVEKDQVVLTAPVSAGTVVLRGVSGTDSDVIVTKNVPAPPQEYTGGRIR